MEGPLFEVCEMMHLLLDHGETIGHLHQTLIDVYQNFTSIHKASITVLELVVLKFHIPLDLSYEIGIFITFCRCSLMMWIVDEVDGTINRRLAILLADIERHLVTLIRDCSNQLSCEDFRIHRLHYLASIKFMVARTANAYLAAFAQGYCYSPSNYHPMFLGYELVMGFVDQVLEDLEIGCGWEELKEALKRDLIFVRNYLELILKEDKVSGAKELNDFMISVRVVISKIACCSFLRRYKLFIFYQVSTGIRNRIESDVRFDVLRALVLPFKRSGSISSPMTDELLISYVNFFQQSLLELLKHEEAVDLKGPLEKDQFKILHGGLQFILRLLTNYGPKHRTEQEKKLTDIRVRFQDLARKVGSFIYSCFSDPIKGSIICGLSDLIEKAHLVEEETIGIIYCMVLDRMELESGRTDQLSFLILLLEYLNELVDRKSALFVTWKDQFGTIQKNLVLLGSFLLSIRHNNTTGDGSEHIEDSNDMEMDTQLKILVEKLRFCINYVRLDQICGDAMSELLISAQVVAFRISCRSLLRRYGVLDWHKIYSKTEKWVDSHMHVKILGVLILTLDSSATAPLTHELLVGYVGCVKDNLKFLANYMATDPLKEQFKTFHELLSSLVHLLTSYRPKHNTHQEKLSDIKLRFQDLVRNIGTVICSCSDNLTEGNTGTELSTWLSDLTEKMNLMKVETVEILPLIILNRIGRESPKTNQLGFLDFLLGDWEHLMGSESNLRSWKDQFHVIHENLVLFRSFMENVIASNTTGDDEFQNLCTRVTDAGYVAEYLFDSFSNRASPLWSCWIREFMEHIELIRAAVMEVNDKYANDMEVSNADEDPTQVLRANGESNNLNRRVSSQSLIPTTDEVVGFEVEVNLLREQLASNLKQLDVVSIIGMAGLGKTTLARKIYEDPFVANHFQLRAWCVVSQEYNNIELFLTILASLIELSNPIQRMSEVDLSVLLYKQLMGRRYLIVLDDVWEINAFVNLKRFFPDDGNGSRIMLTTRNKVIGLEAKCHSDPVELGLLSHDESWNLLERKVYREEKCPLEFCQVGKEIAGKCRGLPLAIVLVAGLLAKSVRKRYFWEQVAGNLSSYLARDSQTVWMPALELSYEYLPEGLKPFFLYLGAFPEDKEIPTDKLICLWVAEGFVQKTELRSSEIQAETNLMDLIDRSLVMIAKRRSDGRVKACHVHDLLRDMCLAKAREANFLHQIYAYDQLTDPIIYQRRLSVSTSYSGTPITYDYVPTLSITPPLRTFLFFNTKRSLLLSEEATESVFSSVKLLKVFHCESTTIDYDAYEDLTTLVHLRYMSIRASCNSIPLSISSLSNLQTLIVKGIRGQIVVPDTIWEMLKLRHLHVNDRAIFSDTLENSSRLENLVTLSTPAVDVGEEKKLIRKVPNLEKLRCILSEGSNSSRESYQFPDFESLNKLESLKVLYYGSVNCSGKFKLPPALKKLSLSKFRLKWSEISIFQKLPDLEVLSLHWGAVEDELWDTGDDVFPKLKSLKLEKLNIKRWNASAENFPRLEKLVVERCKQLEEIPSSFGDFYSLRKVEVLWCSHSAAKSAKEIHEEQQDAGNELLKVHICPHADSPSYYWLK
ncbi:hypothetical protein OROMI_033801 [Orobanche minor]